MSINPISSSDLNLAYEAFDELVPHMSAIRKLSDVDLFDEARYEAFGIRVLPILQNALDKVEDVLRNRGFFTEDFDLVIGKYQQDAKKIADLEEKIQYLRREPTSLTDKLSAEYNKTKTFSSSNIAGSYLSSSSEFELENDLKFIELLGNISKTFDRVISASTKRDDKELVHSMEDFANAYKTIMGCTPESEIEKIIESLELELIEVQERKGLDLDQIQPA